MAVGDEAETFMAAIGIVVVKHRTEDPESVVKFFTNYSCGYSIAQSIKSLIMLLA